MATIINLDIVRLTRAESALRGGHRSPCEIILFPGVRYERWDTAEESRKRTGRRRTRDQIRLSQDLE